MLYLIGQLRPAVKHDSNHRSPRLLGVQLLQRAYDRSSKYILAVDLLCGKDLPVFLFSLTEATDRFPELSGQEISYCVWRWCKLGKYQPVHKPSRDYVLYTGILRFSKCGN